MKPDVYARSCPSRDILDRIGDTWSVLVIGSLSGGPRRYSELARQIDGISPKMLTQTLRGLERDGLVTRTVEAVVPPCVHYALTPLGETLLGVLMSLWSWADRHTGDVSEARTAYDARAAARVAAEG